MFVEAAGWDDWSKAEANSGTNGDRICYKFHAGFHPFNQSIHGPQRIYAMYMGTTLRSRDNIQCPDMTMPAIYSLDPGVIYYIMFIIAYFGMP